MGVDEGVDFLAGAAHGAFVGGKGAVAYKVVGVEDRLDLVAHKVVYGGEDGCYSCHVATVVFYCLDCRPCGVAGVHRSREDKYIFATDHGCNVLAEYKHTATCVMLGGDDVYRLMRVEIHIVATCKFLGKAGADNLHTVKAEYSIDYGVVIVGDKFLCHRLRFGKSGLLRGDVDVVIDMAVTGGKVPLYNTEE